MCASGFVHRKSINADWQLQASGRRAQVQLQQGAVPARGSPRAIGSYGFVTERKKRGMKWSGTSDHV